MADEDRVVHIFPAAVVAEQVRLIAGALDAAGIGSSGLELDNIAGEVIRRDVFAALAERGVQFGGGCGWRPLPSGGVEVTFGLVCGRDAPMVQMFVTDWMPS